MRSEVLNSVTALTHVQIFFENEQKDHSLTSTDVSFVTQTQAINSTIHTDTNELKEMILNLQKQITTLQNNTKKVDTKSNHTKKVSLQQVTVQGNRKQFNTTKYCWSHSVCAHNSDQ